VGECQWSIWFKDMVRVPSSQMDIDLVCKSILVGSTIIRTETTIIIAMGSTYLEIYILTEVST